MALFSTASIIVDLGLASIRLFICEYRDYGSLRTILLNSVLRQAKTILNRVRTHVVWSLIPHEGAESIRNSYLGSTNMVAVAAAIVAQIAITGLSLSHVEEVHWTAEAAFVASLVCSCFSVYSACLLFQKLSSLHNANDVIEFLVTIRSINEIQYNDFPSTLNSAILEQMLVTTVSGQRFYRIPSFDAAMMLVAPSQLLAWSLAFFLIGLGIVSGEVFTKQLGTYSGDNASLAVLLVYILVTVAAATLYFGPAGLKAIEDVQFANVQKEIALKPEVELENMRARESAEPRVPPLDSNKSKVLSVEESRSSNASSTKERQTDYVNEKRNGSRHSTKDQLSNDKESLEIQKQILATMQELIKLMSNQQVDAQIDDSISGRA